MKEKGYIAVFKGSAVEADQVHDYLSENAIGSLVRNHLQENFLAGWMSVEADHSAEVFVSEDDFLKAEALVKNIFHAGAATDEPALEGE